jgi:hypothetical protein
METTFVNMSADQIEVLTGKLDQVIQQNHSIVETQDKMLFLISGNPLDKDDKGLVGEFKEVKKDVERFKKYYWMIVGGSFVAGVFMNFVFKYIFKL